MRQLFDDIQADSGQVQGVVISPFAGTIQPVFRDERVTLYHGDALDILPTMQTASIDGVVSDPPFAFAGGNSNGRSSRADSQFFEHWLVSIFKELYRVTKPESAWFLWGDWRTLPVYDSALQKAAPDYHEARWVSQAIIHDREMVGMGNPFRNQTDWIACIRGKKTDFNGRIPKDQPNIIRDYWYYGKHPNHPAEKSVKVAQQLVEWVADPQGTILDFCAGSATTLHAARTVNRRAIGIEKEQGYCETATARLNRDTLTFGEAI